MVCIVCGEKYSEDYSDHLNSDAHQLGCGTNVDQFG
jgi:hypothetical protein